MGEGVRNLSLRQAFRGIRGGQARAQMRREHRRRREQLRREEYEPTDRARDERNARTAGYAARDLTAVLMGDPPVGFSARDRRGGEI